ncbi:MAG: DNA methyltransferase [Candidatus Hodarchaeota archaeon]
MSSRLIEQTFPIQEVSKLAIPERSSYKPIYQISKWFARRSSSTFRALLLGALLPASEDLMANFYSNHDFSDITVIDPFVGGGTTVIESLRLGLNCIGIDINPVAWFITKTEAELVNLEELEKWIRDCEEKIKSQIKKWYVTECPICNHQADIIYAHWVKLVPCENCSKQISLFRDFLVAVKGKNTSIFCPSCTTVFNHLGSIRTIICCPQCQFEFNPLMGNRIGRNNCKCPICGDTTNILDAQKKNQQILESKLYAIEGYCANCANADSQDSPLKTTRYKFIKGISKTDLDLFNQAKDQWIRSSAKFPCPRESIPFGVATKTLHNHNYNEWVNLFNERQLLALTMILRYIHQIPDIRYQEMFLASFINLLNHNNVFTRYSPKGQKVEGIFSRHDFHPLSTYAENNVWGTKYGRGTWKKCLIRLLKGKEYNFAPYNYQYVLSSTGKIVKKKFFSGKIDGKTICEYPKKFPSIENNLLLLCQDSEDLKDLPLSIDLIISDPPYGDNVNYSELSDFFYVWLRLILKDRYKWFKAKETPKDAEAIISPDRLLNYYDKLVEIFAATKSKLKPDGLLVFTFHHSNKQIWLKLADVIVRSGFQVIKTYTIPSEARNVLNIQKKKAIAFDLIVVCRTNIQKPYQSISLDEFQRIFKKQYQERFETFRKADIVVKDYDHLAMYFGILLEMHSQFQAVSPSGDILAQNEVWESCYDIIAPSSQWD